MSLFGGDQSQTTTSNQKTTVTLPKWLDPSIQSLVPKINAVMDTPYQAYTGDRLASFSPDETQSFDMVRNLLGAAQPGIDTASGIANEVAQRGLQGFNQSTLDQYMNPYTQNVMDINRGRMLDEFDRRKLDLQKQQGSIGSFGGSRASLAQGQLYDNFARNLAETEQKALADNYNQAQNRAFQGTQLAGQAGMDIANLGQMGQQAGYRDATAMAAQGAQQRGLEQAGLDIPYQDFLTEKAYPYQQLQFGSGLLQGLGSLMRGSNTNTTQTSTTDGGSGILGSILGIASMAMGIPGVGAGLGSMLGAGGSGLMSSFASGLSNIGGLGGFGGGFGVSQDLNALLSQGLGRTFKQGGQVPTSQREKLKYEENDLASKLDSFYDMLTQGSNQMQYAEDLDEPLYPDGPTRGEMLQIWQEQQNSPQGFNDYKCGGQVKHYADGGRVSGLDAFLDMYTKPASEWRYATPDEPDLDMNALQRLLNRYRSEGGLSGNVADLLENTLASKAAPVQWVRDNPVDAAGLALTVAPVVGPAVGAGVKGLASIASQVPKLLAAAKNSPRALSTLSGLGLIGANHAGDAADKIIAMMHSDPAVAAQVDPNDPVAQFQAAQAEAVKGNPDLARNAGLNPPDISAALAAPAADITGQDPLAVIQASANAQSLPAETKAVPSAAKKAEWNLPLIQFGASLLGSKNSFFKALGEAGQDAMKSVETKEDRIRQQAQDALDARRVAAYEQQVASANIPGMAELKMELMKKKLATDSEIGKNYRALLNAKNMKGMPMYTPEQAWEIASGDTDALSNSGVAGTPSRIRFSDLPD